MENSLSISENNLPSQILQTSKVFKLATFFCERFRENDKKILVESVQCQLETKIFIYVNDLMLNVMSDGVYYI